MQHYITKSMFCKHILLNLLILGNHFKLQYSLICENKSINILLSMLYFLLKYLLIFHLLNHIVSLFFSYFFHTSAPFCLCLRQSVLTFATSARFYR